MVGWGGWGGYSPDNNATPSAQTTGFDNRSECGNRVNLTEAMDIDWDDEH